MTDLLAEILSTIDQFADFTQTEKLVVTVLILFGVAGAVWVVRYVRPTIRERFHSHVGDVLLLSFIGSVLLGAAVSLLVLWDPGTSAVNALGRIEDAAGKGVTVLLALVVLAGAYIATGFVKRAIDRFAEGNDTISQHQSEIIYRVSQLTVYVSAIAVILGMWSVDLSGLLVGAGFLGIVVGMAARQTLGAMLAGFVLMLSRPFEIGDWVEIDGEEGIVTDISVVNTRIQTFAGEYVMIPNDIVSGTQIINKSRKGRLRIEVEVGVDYETDVERAAEIAEETMKDCDELLTVPTPKVVLKEFGGSSVALLLRFWIDKPSARRKWRARTAVIESVKEAFEQEGIKIPYPQRELSGREEAGGLQLTGEPEMPEATADGGVTEEESEENDEASEETEENDEVSEDTDGAVREDEETSREDETNDEATEASDESDEASAETEEASDDSEAEEGGGEADPERETDDSETEEESSERETEEESDDSETEEASDDSEPEEENDE